MTKRAAKYYIVKRNDFYVRETDSHYKASGVALKEAFRWKATELGEAWAWALGMEAKNGESAKGAVYRVVSKSHKNDNSRNKSGSAKPVDQRVDVAGLLMSLIDDIHECLDANKQMLDACSQALEIVS